MINVLITGANGFIGNALCKRLAQDRNYNVIKVPHKVLESVKEITSFLPTKQIDFVFHLAAYGNFHGQTDPIKCEQANKLNTQNLLKALRYIPYKRFIFASSSSVYGKQIEPMREDMECHPTTMYAKTKFAGEDACCSEVIKYGKPVIIARLFSVYGHGEADERFIPTVIRNIIQGTEFELDQEANHSWIYIDDVIDTFVVFILTQLEIIPTIINIGIPYQDTNERVVKLLEQISGKGAKFTGKKNMRPQDSKLWLPDDRRLLEINGLPQLMLKEGLGLTYQWYKQKYGNKK